MQATALAKQTGIVSHGIVEDMPLEVWGEGPVVLRVGNGGAGATGLLEAVCKDFLSATGTSGSISWVVNHSRNTQLALYQGYIDVALTYERDQENLAASLGWSITAGCIFHDHFVFAGPAGDPAGVRFAASIPEALQRIARSRALFHSRADASATMWKERAYWKEAGLQPWDGSHYANWYKMSELSPAQALVRADAAEAYLLIDRSTLLRQAASRTISNTSVFFEPTSASDPLMNSGYALFSPSTAPDVYPIMSQFILYLLSPRGQGVISSFGTKEVSLPLFAGVKERYAQSRLRGGRPVDGTWTQRALF